MRKEVAAPLLDHHEEELMHPERGLYQVVQLELRAVPAPRTEVLLLHPSADGPKTFSPSAKNP